MLLRSIFLFAAAAVAEVGGAFLIWRGVREGAGPLSVLLGAAALIASGLLATLQPSSHFERPMKNKGLGSVLVGFSEDFGRGISGSSPREGRRTPL